MSVEPDCTLLRKRADQCRLLAGGSSDEIRRDQMLALAIDYEALALQMARRLLAPGAQTAAMPRAQPRERTRLPRALPGRG